ncbi:UNVERIFIED_ORG: putative MFS family arabinose efflux permease [Idiomarina abyssalis]|uniref:organoarsenical effux MFS transporter ArsJ n=1 Tax=Idiomarina TaxID=135575 RepID=UPI000D71C03B|nr:MULTISPECIES: organoarsenical effux MFS transporter ArsJ [Idiomarina]PWW34892.1 putative MFS family arabinose efflux permease [Idiomarina loihiensis]TDO51944.1 putative MFS family arabinose efflux permease [Idiomarina sp. 017G]TDP44727.1 putative MFS family arabinose efflux permease [Idiomarina loihiensis]TDS20943.1 putative MFS family arabinose efflux permease [Idiomarina sp. H2]
MLSQLSPAIRQYLIVTGNYWAFTLTDGALRMLVVLHFHQLGYSALEVAMLFLFYEFFGIVTNLFGGWLGARWGLNRTMNIGLGIQIVALAMLLVPGSMLTVIWVMAAQALSGIAKDLNKMSAKSTIKLLVPDDKQGQLYKWVAILTGSKNTLKGVGFFLGGLLLTLIGFQGAVLAMAVMLSLVWVVSLIFLKKESGKAKFKPKFKDILSKSRPINILSGARFLLFGARDVWFVVALPVFLASQLDWNHWQVGSFLALWVIGYGFVQSVAPKFTKTGNDVPKTQAVVWNALLTLSPLALALALWQGLPVTQSIIIGLGLFGILFAINSSLHSYLIVSYSRADGVSLDVGFYYMANAAGRLMGTVLSGWVYQQWGLVACLMISTLLLLLSTAAISFLPEREQHRV